MRTLDGILTFMSRINTTSDRFEAEKCFSFSAFLSFHEQSKFHTCVEQSFVNLWVRLLAMLSQAEGTPQAWCVCVSHIRLAPFAVGIIH